MITINNGQTEPIRILYGCEDITLKGGCSCSFPIIANEVITIKHVDSLNHFTNVDKAIKNVVKSCVLIIDSAFILVDFDKNASITIRNGVYEYITNDFGYLYFDVFAENCGCYFNSCEVVNQKQVLYMQRLIRFGECYDFPPFSVIGALLRYSKIKKMCTKKYIFDFLEDIYHNTGQSG